MIRNILIISFLLQFSFTVSAQRPNIVWITCEDMSPHLGSYGETIAKTPNLDALAKDGMRFSNAFTTAGVCAPSRASIITGMYHTFIGAQNMRVSMPDASINEFPSNFISYQAVPPPYVKCFPEYLRAAGYYCTNNSKTDYQFQAPPTVWDESSKNAHYRNRPDKNQPFFSVFNIETTHEGQVNKLKNEDLLIDPDDVLVPPYYPDTKIVRDNIARFLTNVMRMDKRAGQIIDDLKKENIYDNTIIFFYSDHGDALPYVKREILKRGIHVPLLVKMPLDQSKSKGMVSDRMISFIDLAPTVLSLAGVTIPQHFKGKAFLGNAATAQGHTYIFAARNRMDANYEMARSVHDGKYQLIKNYYPDLPRYYDNYYRRNQQPMMEEILNLRKEGKLNETVLRWFSSKPVYELYDLQNDPHELNDLAKDSKYQSKLVELQKALADWQAINDPYEQVPEMEMVDKWWSGKKEMPVTELPVILVRNNVATISCLTPGASIGYKMRDNESWKVYTGPFPLKADAVVSAVAHRIGYKRSKVVTYN